MFCDECEKPKPENGYRLENKPYRICLECYIEAKATVQLGNVRISSSHQRMLVQREDLNDARGNQLSF